MVANNWLPLTASVLVALSVPPATLLRMVGVPFGLKVTQVLSPASSYLTPTAAVLTRLSLMLVKASLTLLLSRVPVTAPLPSMVVVVKVGVVTAPVAGSI